MSRFSLVSLGSPCFFEMSTKHEFSKASHQVSNASMQSGMRCVLRSGTRVPEAVCCAIEFSRHTNAHGDFFHTVLYFGMK